MQLHLVINQPGEVRTWPPDCTLVTEQGEPIEGIEIRDVTFRADGASVLFRVKCASACLAFGEEDETDV